MTNIIDYDLFIFDFDGTLMDTEEIHFLCWKKVLTEFLNREIDFTIEMYSNYFHSLKNNNSKNYLELMYNIDNNNYDEIYKKKQEYYIDSIKDQIPTFINGAYHFLEWIIEKNKKFIIVSNTSDKVITIFKKKYEILNKADIIYTKECFFNKKPNPECYLRILENYKDYKKIGFEDSLIGIHALYQVNEILPVFIYNKNYYYTEKIIEEYKNIIITNNFNLEELNINLNKKYLEIENHNNINNQFIDKILNNNITELKKNYNNMHSIINNISILINNMNNFNNIYLSGMGKSGYVCKKSASTWQSLSLKCSYIDLPNLPHGDFGIFKDNDIFIIISNSGNTEEIIYILNYIKNKLNKKIITIAIVANMNCEIKKLCTFTYCLENIIEADEINMTPSTSSLIFMALLDGIAINVKKNITKNEFKLVHPAGSLGKR